MLLPPTCKRSLACPATAPSVPSCPAASSYGDRVTHLPLLPRASQKHPEASNSLSAPDVGDIPSHPLGQPSVWAGGSHPLGLWLLGTEALVPCPMGRLERGTVPFPRHCSLLFPGMQQGVKRLASRWVCFSCSLTCSVLLEPDPAMEKPGLVQKHKQASPLKPV